MERRTFLSGVGGAAGVAAGGGLAAAETITTRTTGEEIEILRNQYHEPHVYAESVYALGYGNGYAQAGDRLFQMDVIRHIGYGDSASVLGAGQLSSDIQVRRDLYSEEQIDRQWETAPPTFKEVVRGYADGVNRRMVEMAASGGLPAEFGALGHAPEPWQPQDTVAAVNYLIGFFGVSGGAELSNAQTLYRLQKNLGSWEAAFDAYADLNWLETTDDHYTSLTDADVDVDGGETVPDAWANLPDDQRRFLEAADPDRIEPWGIERDVALPDAVTNGLNEGQGVMAGFKWGSNAAVVSGDLTESGEPMLGGGPQMGYFKPPVPYKCGLHGAGYDMAGIGVTAAPALVIGRTNGGEDGDGLGWTVTSGRDDMIDTIAVELDPEDRHRYRWEGEWHRMDTRTERHVANPVPPALGGNPRTRVVEQEVAHVEEEGDTMPVVAWNPEECVAWCQRTTTRNDEVKGAFLWVELAGADDLDDYEDTLREFPFTFNFHVISDSGDIAYYHTGKVPDRQDGADYRFPRNSENHSWTGTSVGLGLGTWARNPERGYVVQWNNGPAPDWGASDNEQNWGSIHRVDQLDRILREAAGLDDERGRPREAAGQPPQSVGRPPESATDALAPADMAEIIHRAALHDAAAYASAPFFADAARQSDDPQIRAMGEHLRAWADADADWYDDDDGEIPFTDGEDDRYDQPGHAIYDDLRDRLQREVFDVTTPPGEPGPGIDWEVSVSRHAAPHGTVGDDVTFIDALRGDTDYDWFDGRRDELIREALAETADALSERFETDDPSEWLEPTHKSRFLSLGASQRTEMDMRNRASYNQVLDADGWQSDDEATWQATARDVFPPGNNGVITPAELAQQQATGEEPDRLTDQQELYEDNEYKPHPVTRTQVEATAVSQQTLRAAGPDGMAGLSAPEGVPAAALDQLADVLEDPFETAAAEAAPEEGDTDVVQPDEDPTDGGDAGAADDALDQDEPLADVDLELL
jgi:penicillin amidase